MWSTPAKSWEANWICWWWCCWYNSCRNCSWAWETRECCSLWGDVRSSESTREGVSRWINKTRRINRTLISNWRAFSLSFRSSVLGTWSEISTSNSVKHLLNCIDCVFNIWKSICIHSLCCILYELTWAITLRCKVLSNTKASCIYSSVWPLDNSVD